jgi:hypothetical protein
MMRFARGSARNPGPSDVPSAFAAVRDVLQESLSRLEIGVRAELPDQLTAVQCGQSDLERLLFNLMSNGRDALPNGGTLTVAVRMADPYVEITVSDDGIGMTSETLAQIESPFFTTKEHGLDSVSRPAGRLPPRPAAASPSRAASARHARHRAPVGGSGRYGERLMPARESSWSTTSPAC